MADTIINEEKNRTFTYDALSIFRMDSTAGNTSTLAYIQNWNFNPNMADFDITRIDSAKPIFTKKSDILGAFDFEVGNTTEIYDSSIGTLNEALVTYWVNQMVLGDPVETTFLVKMRAADPDAVGNKFVTFSWLRVTVFFMISNRSIPLGCDFFLKILFPDVLLIQDSDSLSFGNTSWSVVPSSLAFDTSKPSSDT